MNIEKLKALQDLQFWRDCGVEMSVIEEIKAEKNEVDFEKLPYKSLSELKNALLQPGICDLQKNATNLVFADGNPKSQVMIFGEAPGKNEDLEGIPFCGRSGQLLNKMLAAINLDRQQVYITNPVFWRPPENRQPTEQEIAICTPYVENHIALINPKVIFLLGATALWAILKIQQPLSKLRGQLYYYSNQFLKHKIPVVISFHPAYLLRQPSQKKLAMQDLLLLKSILGQEY